MQDELFQIEETPMDRLSQVEARGIQFITIAQAAAVLGFTDYEVRYVISLYRLDALLIAGSYRIPVTAMKTFLTTDEQEAYNVFYRAIKAVEIKGVYSLVKDGSLEEVKSSLEALSLPLDRIIDLTEKDTFYNYSEMPGNEDNPIDWYGLDKINWPSAEATISDYAAVLQVHPRHLAAEIGRSASDQIDWPEFYDFLIEREVINLPCPFNVERPAIPKPENTQLSLFN